MGLINELGSLPGIATGASILEGVMNPILTGIQNSKNRRFAEYMYGKQRADALADWNMQNQYNSPAAQMARFKQAGLNPNLIYGQGNEAATVRSSDFKEPNQQAPQINSAPLTGALFGAVELKQRQEQTNNLRLQGELMRQQTLQVIANTLRTGVMTETDKFNLSQTKQLAATNIEFRKAQVQELNTRMDETKARIGKIGADTQYTLDQNERQKLLTANTLAIGVQTVKNMRAQRGLIKQQTLTEEKRTAINELDRALKAKGFSWSDPWYFRIASTLIDSEVGQDVIKKVTGWLRNVPANSGELKSKLGEKVWDMLGSLPW